MKRAFSETLKMDIIAAVKNNLSVSEIVESCGVSMATAYRYKTKIDSLSSIKQISNAYKVDYQKLCRYLKANSLACLYSSESILIPENSFTLNKTLSISGLSNFASKYISTLSCFKYCFSYICI